MISKGDYVRIWFDAGAGRTGGVRIVYGIVIAAGQKAFRVRWESGLTNRVRHDDPKGVTRCLRSELDEIALRRLQSPA